MTDPLELQNEAREIVSRPAFLEPSPSIVDRVFDWIGDRLDSLFGGLFGGFLDGTSSGIASVLLLVAAVGLGYVIVRVLAKHTPARRRRPQPLKAEVTSRRDSAGWLRVAKQCEASGEFANAVRAYHRVATTRLAESGRVRDTPGTTAGQFQRDFTVPEGEETEALAHLTDAFEGVWYGGDDADIELTSRVAHDALKIGQR